MNQFTLTIHKIGLNTAFRDLKSTLIKIKLFLTGLDSQLISRWIRHPQAFLRTGKPSNLILIIRLYWLIICCICTPCISTVLGARIESQRKRSHFAHPVRALSCGYSIHLSKIIGTGELL